MRRRGIASVIAIIFLVLLIGIGMELSLRFITIYKSYSMVQSEIGEWEARRLRENLVMLSTSGGGGGGETPTKVNIPIVVAKEEFNLKGVDPKYPCRLWKYDSDFNKKVKLKMKPPKNSVNLTMYFGKYGVYPTENWKLNLTIRYRNPSSCNVKLRIYNYTTDGWDDLTTLPPSNDNTVTLQIDPVYVYRNQLKFNLQSLSCQTSFYVGIFVINATLSYPNLKYEKFNVTEGYTVKPQPLDIDDLALRDGEFFSDTKDNTLYVNITGLPTTVTYRDITGFITLGAKKRTWNIQVEVYNFVSNSWTLLNSTVLEGKTNQKPGEEIRLRVPLTTDFISSTGKVMERITYDVISYSSGQFRIDEIVIESSWVESGGGGGGGGAGSGIIRNDSPFDARITRIFYIKGNEIYIYDPSPEIVLKPGETLDLSTIHSLSSDMEIKVVTTYGNVFTFHI